jgi:hypothetical protein
MALIGSRSAGAAPAERDIGSGERVALKKYDVVINGYKTTLQLSDADAAAMGLTPANARSAAVKAKRPANKSRTPANKSAQGR